MVVDIALLQRQSLLVPVKRSKCSGQLVDVLMSEIATLDQDQHPLGIDLAGTGVVGEDLVERRRIDSPAAVLTPQEANPCGGGDDRGRLRHVSPRHTRIQPSTEGPQDGENERNIIHEYRENARIKIALSPLRAYAWPMASAAPETPNGLARRLVVVHMLPVAGRRRAAAKDPTAHIAPAWLGLAAWTASEELGDRLTASGWPIGSPRPQDITDALLALWDMGLAAAQGDPAEREAAIGAMETIRVPNSSLLSWTDADTAVDLLMSMIPGEDARARRLLCGLMPVVAALRDRGESGFTARAIAELVQYDTLMEITARTDLPSAGLREYRDSLAAGQGNGAASSAHAQATRLVEPALDELDEIADWPSGAPAPAPGVDTGGMPTAIRRVGEAGLRRNGFPYKETTALLEASGMSRQELFARHLCANVAEPPPKGTGMPLRTELATGTDKQVAAAIEYLVSGARRIPRRYADVDGEAVSRLERIARRTTGRLRGEPGVSWLVRGAAVCHCATIASLLGTVAGQALRADYSEQ